MSSEISKFNTLFGEFLEKIISAFPNNKLKTLRGSATISIPKSFIKPICSLKPFKSAF